MQVIDIINKLSTARMEYQSNNGSVLNKFVVPYFIDSLDLRKISHSIALVGSRGSGKSTYIQYFSHATRFDIDAVSADKNELDCILLYWKPDIAYCQGLKYNWLKEKALLFFSLHSSLSVLQELARLISNLSNHYDDFIDTLNKNNSFWRRLSIITKKEIKSIEDMLNWVDDYKYELSTRLNPVNTEGLLSIQPNSLLEYLTDALRVDYKPLKNTVFKIFVDEFELLTLEQQRNINTYRKESTGLLSWNVAYKANATPSKETNSDQCLQSPDDFREVNIDELMKNDYKIFAAEIFILTLQNSGLDCDIEELSPSYLGNRENIKSRREESYRKSVLSIVSKILPTPSIKDLSNECVTTNSVKTIVKNILEEIGYSSEIINKIHQNPSIAITIVGTYKQKNFDPKLWEKYLNEGTNKSVLKAAHEKINTYEFNTLLSLNLQHTAMNVPVYAGFERFIIMTTPNIRHFKELCLNALRYSQDIDTEVNYNFIKDIKSISAVGMHDGAVATSSSLVKEVLSYPPYGNKLARMVNRIGELFRISQKSSYQSEPERVIFTIPYDYAGSDEELESFLNSALSWRVLIADNSKRTKDDNQITDKEYQLNPIYSPRFGISYRKKRGITFSVREFKVLYSGSSEEFEFIKKSYQKRWKSESPIQEQGILL